MKILGIIPARYESTRFPGKPLVEIQGKSMIQRVYEQCKKAQLLHEVVVATDDERIFNHVKSFGGKVMMTSTEHQSGTERCGEVLIALEDDGENFDVIVNIQGDEPLVDYRQLDQLCEAFKDETVQIATLGINDVSDEDKINPNRIKIVLNDQGNALYFSRSAIPNTANAKPEIVEGFEFYRHIGLYAYRTKTLSEIIQLKPTQLEKIESLEQLRWLYYGYKIKVVSTTIETPNIDVPADLEKVLNAL